MASTLIKTTTWLLDDTFLQPKGVTMHALGQSKTISKPYNNDALINPGNYKGVWIQWNGMAERNVDKLDDFNRLLPPYTDHF